MNVPGPVAVADTERHAEQILAFRLHAAVFAATMVLIVLVNLLTNLRAGIAGDLSAWWSIWALLGWSLSVG
ncbi:MAG: 2TM domain-containing protein, partial [Actinomycetota bacterium]